MGPCEIKIEPVDEICVTEITELPENRVNSFKCPICSFSFKTERNRKQHLEMSPRYVCSCCDAVFHTKDLVGHHMRSSPCSFLVPYACTKCHKAYKEKKQLDQHMKCGHKIPEFQCSVCQKIYKHKSTLNNHVRNKHPSSNWSWYLILRKIKYWTITFFLFYTSFRCTKISDDNLNFPRLRWIYWQSWLD